MVTRAQPLSVIRDIRNRDIGLAEMGVRGSLRLAQTVMAVYPRALRWLVQWRKPRPQELREMFETLGATYIKFGQFIASSPSVFPKEYVDEFQRCLDQTPAIPFARIKKIIEQDLGKSLNRVYAHIDEQPLASASIAQVHAAKLLSGEDVVVKVQKPGVRAVLTTDMNAVYLLMRILELIIPNTDQDAIAGIVEEMYQSMLDECDFNKEAENLLKFDRFLQESGNDSVVVPRPYLQASSLRVLTMERLYGVALTNPDALSRYQGDPAECLFNAMNTWFASLTQCDFFHADLHSGNLLLLDEGRVGFIDFGMVGHIRPEIWQATFALIMALGEEDYQAIAESMLTIGITREHVDVDALAGDIRRIFRAMNELEPEEMLAPDPRDAQSDGVTRLMNDLGDLAKSYGIRFPRAFTMLLKQFLYFDRYLDIHAPETDIFHDDRLRLMAY